MLSEGDKDKDGLVEEAEWSKVELWFQYRAFLPGSEADLEAEAAGEAAREAARREAFDRAAGLKQVLWDMFVAPAPEGSPVAGSPRLDFRSVLLYLCADRDQFSGIKKAFSVVANSIATNARADAAQLFRAAYPLGPEAGAAIHRAPLDQAQIAGVVETIYKARGGKPDGTPAISAEQLMYSMHGEKVVSHLMGRYLWKDVFVSTKLASF